MKMSCHIFSPKKCFAHEQRTNEQTNKRVKKNKTHTQQHQFVFFMANILNKHFPSLNSKRMAMQRKRQRKPNGIWTKIQVEDFFQRRKLYTRRAQPTNLAHRINLANIRTQKKNCNQYGNKCRIIDTHVNKWIMPNWNIVYEIVGSSQLQQQQYL